MNDLTGYTYLVDEHGDRASASNVSNTSLADYKFCWFHYKLEIDDDTSSVINEVKSYIEMDDYTLEELFSEDTRPAFKNYQNGHLLIIRCINPNRTITLDEMVPLHIWIKDRTIITVSYSDVFAVENLKSDIESLQIQSRSAFMIELFTRIIDRITEVVNEIDSSIDDLDSELESNDFSISIELLLQQRKRLLALRRYTNPQKDLIQKSLKGTGINYDESQSFIFRDLSDQYYKLIEDIDHLRDKLTVILESVNNKRNENMNQTMYTLSIVASLFLPLGFLTGLLGVNVGGMPGVDSNNAFWILSLLCAVIIVLEIVLMKQRKII